MTKCWSGASIAHFGKELKAVSHSVPKLRNLSRRMTHALSVFVSSRPIEIPENEIVANER